MQRQKTKQIRICTTLLTIHYTCNIIGRCIMVFRYTILYYYTIRHTKTIQYYLLFVCQSGHSLTLYTDDAARYAQFAKAHDTVIILIHVDKKCNKQSQYGTRLTTERGFLQKP